MKLADDFYVRLKEPYSSCLGALRTIILQHDSAIHESIKYGMPFFCYRKSMLCYFWIDKKSGLPYIGFMEGKYLDYEWLETGDRSRIKIMYIDPYEDIPLKTVKETLRASIMILAERSTQKS
jgi:penicillin-binding protein-related factor A (putative recombinase)